MDELIAQFTGITNSSARQAENYLKVSDGDLEQAIQLFFDTGGADMEGVASGSSAAEAALTPSAPTLPERPTQQVIQIDSDPEDDDMREAMTASGGNTAGASSGAAPVDDDELMARRLQEELYAESGGDGVAGADGVRAPIAKTRETLVGGDEDFSYPDMLRHVPRTRRGGPPGIFNQRQPGVWDAAQSSASSAADRRRLLAEATGGASEASNKSSMLAEMYRPPFEIICHLSFEDARSEARDEEKWILINIQDQEVFDSQVLNRDIWKTPEVQSTVKENFLFLQMDKTGRDGRDYIRLYLPRAADPSGSIIRSDSISNLFPHIAIIDPRTGEQVKVWAEIPKNAMEFVMQLHEFLDRFSLKVDAKNPVQKKSKQKVDVDHMTEEEMMQMAMQNSLGSDSASVAAPSGDGREPVQAERLEHIDDLMDFEEDTTTTSGKGKEVAVESTPFQRIRQDRHHHEPPPGPETTKIQFKMHDGSKVVRRFLVKDRVEQLFEYVKADLIPELERKKGGDGTQDKQFELVSLGQKLIEILDITVEEAGLKMGTVMVETLED